MDGLHVRHVVVRRALVVDQARARVCQLCASLVDGVDAARDLLLDRVPVVGDNEPYLGSIEYVAAYSCVVRDACLVLVRSRNCGLQVMGNEANFASTSDSSLLIGTPTHRK